MNNILLGILGGLGPMSGIYFCEMLTAHTLAKKDSDHINFLLSSRADTPDRSSFILGQSQNDPSPVMVEEAKRLQSAGVGLLSIPCNTAHYFYEKIQNGVDVPVINIIEETARFCAFEGVQKVGVLATAGTAASGAYARVFSGKNIAIEPLREDEQAVISRIIFEEIKCGSAPSLGDFFGVCDALMQRGCQRLILGCTELSLIKKNNHLPPYFIDSLEILALAAIKGCNKTPVGFDDALMKFYERTDK